MNAPEEWTEAEYAQALLNAIIQFQSIEKKCLTLVENVPRRLKSVGTEQAIMSAHYFPASPNNRHEISTSCLLDNLRARLGHENYVNEHMANTNSEGDSGIFGNTEIGRYLNLRTFDNKLFGLLGSTEEMKTTPNVTGRRDCRSSSIIGLKKLSKDFELTDLFFLPVSSSHSHTNLPRSTYTAKGVQLRHGREQSHMMGLFRGQRLVTMRETNWVGTFSSKCIIWRCIRESMWLTEDTVEPLEHSESPQPLNPPLSLKGAFYLTFDIQNGPQVIEII